LFLKIAERCFVVMLALYLMGVATILFYPDMRAEDFASTQGQMHIAIALTQAAIYGTGGLLILMRWRRVAAAALKVWPILLLIGLAPVSMLWSLYPAITLRRSILQIALMMVGIYLGERWSIEDFARLLSMAFALTMTTSIALFFLARTYVLDPDHPKSWRGLGDNKNAFGQQMAMAFVLFLLVRFQHFKWSRYIFLLMAFGLMFLSRSMTSVATGVLVVCLLPLWLLARLPPKQRLVALAACGLVAAGVVGLAVMESKFLFQLMGKDSTLTGRTEVWQAILVSIRHHPFLGYGFEAFWTGLKGESLNVIISSGWLVPEAHNGYLELCLALGIPGAIAFLIVVLTAFRHAIGFIRREPTRIALWPAAYLCFFLIHNLGESDLLNNGSQLGTSLLVIIVTALTLHQRRCLKAQTEAQFTAERDPVALACA
jgi:exopolysaccharide production protein ExoQ